jgi:hypothetical protein
MLQVNTKMMVPRLMCRQFNLKVVEVGGDLFFSLSR